ncbi:hypothetical protein AgCh_006759 [Apium graveolens]
MRSRQQQQQQRSQGSMVHWETFLHISSIKVLLVENDDSTRHVVAALLRNLNYEVIVAANGLQAWGILEDLTNHIDVVLTEVAMPCLSGIALLCKIMSHKTRKTVPVIMMSTHDSMGLVFKCLSKGAVDFLGKPIRKNELKNLWQHVWRRCHSSSGSRCESRANTQISVKSKSGIKCQENNSSDENMNTGDSDSQSSWTKEVDSSQATSAKDQISKHSEGTCAQLSSKAETFTKLPVTTPKEYQEKGDQSDNVRHGKDLVLGKTKTRELQLNNSMEIPFKLLNANRITHSKIEPDPNKMSRANNLAKSLFNNEKTIISRTPDTASEDQAKTFKSKIRAFDNSTVKPEIELNLKRLRVAKDSGKAIQIERNVLRHSDLSAFSRSKWYNTTSNGCKTSNGIDVSVSLEAINDESDIRTSSNRNLFCPSSEGIKNNVDMDSITDKLPINPAVVSKDSVDMTSNSLKATTAIDDLNLSSVFAPTELDLNCSPQQVILVKTDDLASRALLTPITGSPPELPVRHIHHHHHVHHFHSMDSERPLSKHENMPYKKPENVVVGPVEGNAGNCSLNKSGSGSKYGSNGQNVSSTVVHAEGKNVESEVHVEGNSGSGDATGSASRNRTDESRYAHEEASSTKFRHKKDRKFGYKLHTLTHPPCR